MAEFELTNLTTRQEMINAIQAVINKLDGVATPAALTGSMIAVTNSSGVLVASSTAATSLTVMATTSGNETITGDWAFTGTLKTDLANLMKEINVSPAAPTSGYVKMWICDDGEIHVLDSATPTPNEYIFRPQGSRIAEMYFATTGDEVLNAIANDCVGLSGMTSSSATTGFTITSGVAEANITTFANPSGTTVDMTVGDGTDYTEGAAVSFYNVTGGGANTDFGIIDTIDGNVLTITFDTLTTTGITDGYLVQPSQIKVSTGSAGTYSLHYSVSYLSDSAQILNTCVKKMRPSATPGDGNYYKTIVKSTSSQDIGLGDTGSMSGDGILNGMLEDDIIFLTGASDGAGDYTPLYGVVTLKA